VPGEWVAIANGRPLRVKGTVRSAAANAFDRGVAFLAVSATNPGERPGPANMTSICRSIPPNMAGDRARRSARRRAPLHRPILGEMKALA
jgi:hypothetical protein